jgi:hypothetical protein
MNAMKSLRQIAILVLVFITSPLFAQQSAQVEETRAENFSFQGIVESTEFQIIILLLIVSLAGLCLIYLLGAMALGVSGEKKRNAAHRKHSGRRISLPGADTPRVPLNVNRGASVLSAATHKDSTKSPDREGNPSSDRG